MINLEDIFYFLIAICWPLGLYLIPKYIGTKRNIGWKWSLFFTFFLTWIGGLIVTLLSQKKGKKPRKIINNIIGAFFMLSVLFPLSKLLKTNDYYINYWDYYPVIQGLGLAFYCLSSSNDVQVRDNTE